MLTYIDMGENYSPFSILDSTPKAKVLPIEKIAELLNQSEESVKQAIKSLSLESELISVPIRSGGVVGVISKKGSRDFDKIKDFFEGKEREKRKNKFKKMLGRPIYRFDLNDDFPNDTLWSLYSMEEFFEVQGLNRPGTSFLPFLKNFLENNPDLKNEVVENVGGTYYPQHVFNAIRKAYIAEVVTYINGKDWVTLDNILDKSEKNQHYLGVNKSIIKKVLKKILQDDPTFAEELREGAYITLDNNTTGEKTEAYSPKLYQEIARRIEMSQVPKMPRDWVELGDFVFEASQRLAKILGIEVSDSFQYSVLSEFRSYIQSKIKISEPQTYEIYREYKTLPSEMFEQIFNKLFSGESVKDGWITLSTILQALMGFRGEIANNDVKEVLDQILLEDPTLADEIQRDVIFMPEGSTFLHKTQAYSPRLAGEILSKVKDTLMQRRIQKKRESEEERIKFEQQRILREEKRAKIEEGKEKRIKGPEIEDEGKGIRKSLDTFLIGVAAMSVETLDFRRLLGLFGAGSTLDLLYAFHPEYKKLPVEYLKSQLAKYLGDYMVVRSGSVLQEVELALPYLGEKSLQDSLFTVIKEDAINYYQAEKRKNKENEDSKILDEYVTLLQDKTIIFKNADFICVVERVQAYIDSLAHDFNKPENIVHEIKQGRTFPDLNQKINIKEIRDEKRVLIGDEMGMGKSASAILAKEYLGAGIALVVVPSNVISTWHGYLSDAVGPDGRQLGYFKKGHTPRVLDLSTVEDVDLIESGEYDYVIISHEKFKEGYAEKLKSSPIGMVIIDEVHKFKNVIDGKRSKALLDLMLYFKDNELYTVLLSGTPVPNKIKDLAITLKLLYPKEFGEMDSAILVSSIIKGDNINLRDLLFKKTQMKKLVDSVEMPEKTERDTFVEFNDKEREFYDLLLEDDELTATEKLQTLRQFCLNPRKVFPDIEIQSSKVAEAKQAILSHFETKNKMVLFVNGYIDGIIRGNNSIIEQLQLPSDIQVKIIDGDVTKEERKQIEEGLKYMVQGKVLLVLSGMAADVGVDFSSAEAVYFYNEPWTKFDKLQQQARVYRPGLSHDISVDTSLVKGSVEEGIHYYLEMKYRAIVKLLEGVPLSEIEKSMLLFDEKVGDGKTIDGDQGLAEEWLQSPVNRLNRFFGATKEIGEDKFMSFLEKYGEEYADYYADMGTRGFQANTARFVTALIKKYKEEKGIDGEITILDVASGPEMLAKKVSEDEKGSVLSLDINPAHFKVGTGRQIVAGFTSLPIRESSVDYLNMSLAIHYSTFRPSKGEFERLEVFGEMARVLKVGGRATINLVYSLEWKNREELRELLKRIGLRVIESCTGFATSGNSFVSECLTFEKNEEVDLQEKLQTLRDGERELLDGLKISTKGKTKLKKSQNIVKDFSLKGETLTAQLNNEDMGLLAEQEQIQEEGVLLIEQYGSAEAIPKEELINKSILRYVSGSKSKLIKKGTYANAFIHIN